MTDDELKLVINNAAARLRASAVDYVLLFGVLATLSLLFSLGPRPPSGLTDPYDHYDALTGAHAVGDVPAEVAK